MCGFVAVAQTDPIEKKRLVRQTDALFRRGPDDKGIWVSRDQRVGLGSRRLSIVDLSNNGHMPMTAINGNVAIAFNGEIYNFRLLRNELEGLGYRFSSNTDTEVVLMGYLEWGSDIVRRLNGMFGFAIYDSRDEGDKKIFIARDIAGEKPVLIYEGNGTIIVASELSAIFEDERVSRTLSPTGLDSLLAFGYLPGEQSLILGVRKLLPAHAGFYNLNTKTWAIQSYWIPPGFIDSNKTIDEYSYQFNELLKKSVSDQLMADVPVGIFLSGGLDSSLIVAAAASLAITKVKTFTIAFPGGGSYDESSHAKMVANYFGTEHHVLEFNGKMLDEFEFIAQNLDEPIGDSSILPTSLVSRFAGKSVKVALGGDGGDELFGGYTSYRLSKEHIIDATPSFIREFIANCAKKMPIGMPGRARLSSISGDPRARFESKSIVFNEFDRYRLLAKDIRDVVWKNLGEYSRSSLISFDGEFDSSAAMKLDFQTYLPDDILRKVDRASMMNSLEVRAPFLSRELIDFSFSALPSALKATKQDNKVLLKRISRAVLPKELHLDRKQGFSIPRLLWNSPDWLGMAKEELTSLPKTWFDQAELQRLIQSASLRPQAASYTFVLVLLARWQKRFGVY
jgi:asparagine synthase (glutamine-hydrolysing)